MFLKHPHRFGGLVVVAACLVSEVASAQPFVINEVIPNPALGQDQIVELLNVTQTTQNAAGWLLCNQLLYVAPIGNFPIPPGGTLTVHWGVSGTNTPTDFFTGPVVLPMNQNADSMSLYIPGTTFFQFADPNHIVDFVQWGAGNQPRAITAVAAGEWPSVTAFTPVPGPAESLAFDGDGSTPEDWFRDVTPTVGGPNLSPDAGASKSGTGCAVAGAPATFVAPSAPAPGNRDFTLELAGAAPGAPAILFVGLGTANLPVGAGCAFFVNPAPVLLQIPLGTGPGGGLVLPLTPPESVAGIGLGLQFAILNPASPIGADLSDGLGVQF